MTEETKATWQVLLVVLLLIIIVAFAAACIVHIRDLQRELANLYERYDQQQRYEVVRALDTNPKIIIVHDHKEETQFFYIQKTDEDLYIITEQTQ